MNYKKLKKLREDKELTQQQLADILKVTRSAYSLWEINKNIIPLIKLNTLCNYYEINMDYFIDKELIHKKSKHNTLNKKEIGSRIRQIRKKNGYTQEMVAQTLNTTHSAISAYENGKTMIPTLFLIEISNLFNVSLDWLCDRY